MLKIPFFGGQEKADPLVFGLISLACEVRSDIVVALGDSKMEYRSMFLGVASQNSDSFYIDALGARVKPELIEANKSNIKVSFELNEVQYTFSTEFVRVEPFEGFDALRLKAPSKIDSIQRREFYRVEPIATEPVEIIFEGGDRAEITNLSGGGAAFKHKIMLNPGTRLNLKIKLPDSDEELVAELVVIRVDMDAVTSSTARTAQKPFRIRGRFEGMSNTSHQLIQRYVTNRQRDILRLNV